MKWECNGKRHNNFKKFGNLGDGSSNKFAKLADQMNGSTSWQISVKYGMFKMFANLDENMIIRNACKP